MKKSPLTSIQVDSLKWLAIITMIIDHIPKVLGIEGLYLDVSNTIGRICFPIIAFLIAHNYNYYSKNPKKYIQRLFIWGIISQPIYMYALGDFFDGKFIINILFTLGAGLLLQKAMDDYENNKNKQTTNNLIFSFIFSFFIGLVSGYGVLGVLLIPTFCLWIRKQDIYSFIILTTIVLAVNNYIGSAIMGISIFILLFILPQKRLLPCMAGWFFYLFYPLHLLLLKVIFNLL